MKKTPMTTIFNGIFWINVVGILAIITTLVLWPGVDFSDVGVRDKSFLGFVVGALFSCPWLPWRKKGVIKRNMTKKEEYIRFGGIIIGAILTF